MTTETPIWLQNESFPARLDRQIIEVLATEGVIDLPSGDLFVTERDAGAAMQVDVAPGQVVIVGDDQAFQGSYLCRSTAVEELPITTADTNNPRIDLVIARVRDSNVTGSDDDWILEVLAGTPASSPEAPSLPDTAVALAEVFVGANVSSITDANITDRRGQAGSRLPVGTLSGYVEPERNFGSVSGTVTLDFASFNVWRINPSGPITIQVASLPSAGDVAAGTLTIENSNHAITWPGGTLGEDGLEPAVDGVTVISLLARSTGLTAVTSWIRLGSV
jgi:hypothetical protein